MPAYADSYKSISAIKLVFQLIFYVVIFIAVIAATLYGTKLIAKSSKKMIASKHIKLLDVMNIPGGSKIIISEINNTIYILSTSNSGVSVIDKIKKDDFPIVEEEFDTYLDKYLTDNKLDYTNVKNKVKSFFNKSKRIKIKEENKDEKKD